MHWIYLSPHLDDVALSMGGLLWEQSQAGERVSVWTVCGGDPPKGAFSPFAESLHRRWRTSRSAMTDRRTEDIASCRIMGADYHHFAVSDCIYRRSPRTGEHLYASEEALWFPVHPDEESLVEEIGQQLQAALPAGANLVCPLTLGDHVDHRLTRAAAEKLGIPLWFYAEYPYVLETGFSAEVGNWSSTVATISPRGLAAWQAAVGAHQSQISTFWEAVSEMRMEIQAFYDQMNGVYLWRNP